MAKAAKKSKCEAEKCGAFCCRYISIHLDAPSTRVDIDEMKWFVSHEGVSVYKDKDGDWLVDVVTKCRYLKNNRCSIYETRPDVCREYDPDDCTHSAGDIERQEFFLKPEDVEKYRARRWPKKKKKVAKKKTTGKK